MAGRASSLRELWDHIASAKISLLALAAALAADVDSLDATIEAVRQALSARFELAAGAIPRSLAEESASLALVLRRRFDEISQGIDAIMMRKKAALEAEQVAVDSALEQVADVSAALAEPASSIESPDSEAELDRLAAFLATFPALPVEPTGVRLVDAESVDDTDMTTEQRLLGGLGRLVVVRGARVSDVLLAPPPHFAHPGRLLRLSLSLAPAWGPPLPTDDVPATLAHLAARVSGKLLTLDGMPLDAPLVVTPNVSHSPAVTVAFALPASVAIGTRLMVVISVGAVPLPPPANSIVVACGVDPGLRLEAIPAIDEDNDYRRPVPLTSGVLCVPRARSLVASTTAFDAFDMDAAALPPHPAGLFGLVDDGPVQAMTAAEVGSWWPGKVQPATGAMIVVCRVSGDRLAIFAAPEATACAAEREVPAAEEGATPAQPFWRVTLDDGPVYCNGLTALSHAGIVVVGACGPGGFLSVHSLATGELLARSPAVFYACHVAAYESDDAAADAAPAAGCGRQADIFVAARNNRGNGEAGIFQVYRFRWSGVDLVPQVCAVATRTVPASLLNAAACMHSFRAAWRACRPTASTSLLPSCHGRPRYPVRTSSCALAGRAPCAYLSCLASPSCTHTRCLGVRV